MEPVKELITFDELTKIPNIFFTTLGIQPYVRRDVTARSWLFSIIFYFGFINLNVLVIWQMLYIYFMPISSYLESTAMCACTMFCLVSDFKMLAVWLNKKTLSGLMQDLEEMFPISSREQRKFCLHYYKRNMRMVMVPFSVLYMTLIAIFNLFPICQSTVEYLFLSKSFARNLPFIIWYPFNSTSDHVYPLVYASQVYFGYMAGTGIFSADLLLCCIIIQLCMHFDYISRQFSVFEATGTSRDLDFLNWIVPRHVKILRFSEHINSVFSVSILFNFLISSLIICMGGFQVTAGVDIIQLSMYFLLVITSLIQVLQICYFGQRLMESSSRVGYAAYSHSWQKADQRYWKSLIVIIRRSQECAVLKAITFPPVSLNTFNTVVSMSYQFFALLRTMYGK